MKIILTLSLAGLILSACSTAPVTLVHPDGRSVVCGPYRYNSHTAEAAAMLESQCIQDYKEQGYVRSN